MGLSKSKPKSRRGEAARARGPPGARTRGRSTDRRSPEPEEPPTRPAESPPGKKAAAKGARPSSSEVQENPDGKVKASQKTVVIPQIIITRASRETLTSYSSIGSDEQRTIKEQVEWTPYYRHRNPSTVDAYHFRE
ncbi:spermatogenesis-associated protein 33 [Mustela nigripes]|uniref:Spermatogenesis-associated protein 33 n=1 Tax=Mustela putorius furo TaxID=9669 RepID=A0A8U0RY54_MUSPF|nr:spermatogenesis-associated protein 33 [Mustela putorius furo]XP_059238377.1 spermatogenesis-associated protein 33 [Mustela nigripes]